MECWEIFVRTLLVPSRLEQAEVEVLPLSHVVGEDDLLLELEDRDSGSIDGQTGFRLLGFELVEDTPFDEGSPKEGQRESEGGLKKEEKASSRHRDRRRD